MNLSQKILPLLALAVLAACSSQKGDKGVLKIASVLPLTGPAAILGEDMRKGQELAVEYWEAHGAEEAGSRFRKIDLAIEDSKSLPAEGTKAVHSLLGRGYRLFAVPLSTVALASRSILVDAGALAFLDASHPDLTNPPHPTIFRHSQTAEAEAEALLHELRDAAPGSQVVIFYLNDEYGRSFVEHVESLGQKTDRHRFRKVGYEANAVDFRSLVLSGRLGEEQVAGVMVVGAGRPMGLLLRGIRESGHKGTIYCSIGYAVTGAREILGEQRENILYTDLEWRDNESTVWMVDRFQERLGRRPPVAAVIEYQSLLTIAVAASGAGSDRPEKVARHVPEASRKYIGAAPVQPRNDIFPQVVVRKEDAASPSP